MLQVQNGQQMCLYLKKENLERTAKGTITLQMDVIYNKVRMSLNVAHIFTMSIEKKRPTLVWIFHYSSGQSWDQNLPTKGVQINWRKSEDQQKGKDSKACQFSTYSAENKQEEIYTLLLLIDCNLTSSE